MNKYIIIISIFLFSCSSVGIKSFDRCEEHFKRMDAKNICANGIDDGMKYSFCCGTDNNGLGESPGPIGPPAGGI